MLTVRRRKRLDKSKKDINQKVSQRKKMSKNTKNIVPKRRKINLKIKLKIDPLVRKKLKNDFLYTQYHRFFEKYIIFYHTH